MNLGDYITLNTFLMLGTIVVGIVVIVTMAKKGATDATIESNEILRGLIEDQKAEIIKLRERQHTQGNELQTLKLDFEKIKQERKYLAQLITIALAEHFAANPEAAAAAQSLLAGKPPRKGRVKAT